MRQLLKRRGFKFLARTEYKAFALLCALLVQYGYQVLSLLGRKAITTLAVLEFLEDGKSWWKRGKIKDWMKRRQEQAYADNIVRELMVEDTTSYNEILRMSHEDYSYILSLIEGGIATKKSLEYTQQ